MVRFESVVWSEPRSGNCSKGFHGPKVALRSRQLPNIEEETGSELTRLFEAGHADVDRAFHRLPSTFFVFRFGLGMPSNTSCQLIFTESVFSTNRG